MQKILDKYKANPTAENLARLKAYANKHPFSVCVMPMADQKFLHTLLDWNVSDKPQGLISGIFHYVKEDKIMHTFKKNIQKVIKDEMLRAQKDFAKYPSATNWHKTTRSMLVYQQLIQLINNPYLHDDLADLNYVPMGEWPERIVGLALNMTIDEALAWLTHSSS